MKIFATNHDVGSTNAMIPPLKKLRERGVEVVTFAQTYAPAFNAFKKSGLCVRSQEEYGFSECGVREWMVILDREKPDLIFVGISDTDSGSEKQAMLAVMIGKLQIPFVGICESWPHKWLSNFGARDIPLYNKSRAMLVFDEASKERFIKAGFSEKHLVITGNPAMDTLGKLREEKFHIRSRYRDALGITDDVFVISYAITKDLDEEKRVGKNDPEWLGFYEEDALEDILVFVQSMRERMRKDVRVILRQKLFYGKKQLTKLLEHYWEVASLDVSDDYQAFLCAGDIVVGTTTLLLEHAALIGIPTISYLPALTRLDPKFSNTIGLTLPIYKKEDLHWRLRNAIINPEHVDVFIPNKEINLVTDATERVAYALSACAL